MGAEKGNSRLTLTLEDGIIGAGDWLIAQLTPETTDILLHFSSPTRDLTNFITESIITLTANTGVNVVVQTLGDISDARVRTFGWVVNAQTVVSGSLTLLETDYQLEFRTFGDGNNLALSRYTATIERDPIFLELLHIQPASPDSNVETQNKYAKITEAAKKNEVAKKNEAAKTKDGNFTGGRRAVAVALNPLLGLGSYTMGDWGGGLFQTMGYSIALGLILWDQDVFGPDELFGIRLKNSTVIPEIGSLPAFSVPGTVGLGLAGVTLLFGIFRPIFYHRSPSDTSENKAARVLSGARIAVIPDSTGIKAVRLSYNLKL
ncbi:hypothetical protein FACS189491_00670 [Spirochaetia bacterium]|nr:hypothetical protein FACS189491_00670 [Spirochaetia bacterium]